MTGRPCPNPSYRRRWAEIVKPNLKLRLSPTLFVCDDHICVKKFQLDEVKQPPLLWTVLFIFGSLWEIRVNTYCLRR